jgi:CelD/BcsL family acetyltransferase involved in cellulose biosynthesis
MAEGAGEPLEERMTDLTAPSRAMRDGGVTSLFGSPLWWQALAEGFGLEPRLLRSPGGSLAYCEVDDLRGHRIVSLPFSDYYDAEIESQAAWEALTSELFAVGVPVRFRVLHNPLAKADPRLEPVGAAAWHGIDIGGDTAAAWARLHPSARQNVRRAQRDGVKVRFSTAPADVEIFHALHVSLRKKKYGMLAQPLAFFHAMRDAFVPGDGFHLGLAEQDGRLVAGTLYLLHGGVVYYKFNASIDSASRPNDLLAWAGIQLACERDATSFDFGLSDRSQDGLLRFKRKFATEEATIVSLQHSPRTASPSARSPSWTGALLDSLTGLLTGPEVPDAITARAGDILYRHFC